MHTEPRRAGRPKGAAGEVSKALLHAANKLSCGDHGPTLRELARAACVGQSSAKVAVYNLRRAGSLVIVRERRVDYRTRPVAEYAPSEMVQVTAQEQQASPSDFQFQALTSAWAA